MKLLIIILLLTGFIGNKAQTIETKIIHYIEGEIITNIDIKNEFKYLLALNDQLRELDKEQILKISEESIIREKIKKIELSKQFEEIKINNDYLKEYLKNLYSKLNLNSLNEFEQYLKNYNITLNEIEKKISIDLLWNELIIQKYNNQIKIDRKKIKNKFKNKNTLKLKEYQLSEIIFNVKNKNLIKEKYIEIIKSINEIGFENSASIFSISDSAKIGGDIGWINENSINIKIKKNISSLEIGKISEPIILPNGIMILKVMNIRNSQMKIDMEAEYNKAANFERNRQLNQFSLIYYNKIKKNLGFDE